MNASKFELVLCTNFVLASAGQQVFQVVHLEFRSMFVQEQTEPGCYESELIVLNSVASSDLLISYHRLDMCEPS